MKTVSNFFLPTLLDIILSSAFLLSNFGIEFFSSFIFTYAAYTYFTIDLSKVYFIERIKLLVKLFYNNQVNYLINIKFSKIYLKIKIFELLKSFIL